MTTQTRARGDGEYDSWVLPVDGGVVRRARAGVYRGLELWPALYCAVVRRRVHTVSVATRGVELVIEGFPRSGNSFAREAVLRANPSLRIASHVHRAAHVLHAVDIGIPTLVLVRDVDDAVVSAMFLGEFGSPEEALRRYRRFYRALWPRRDGFVVATFDQVIGDLDSVIERVNERYAVQFRSFGHTAEAEQEVFRRLDAAASDGVMTNQYTVARPSATRARLAASMVSVVRDASPRLRAECQAEAARFSDLAGRSF